MARPTLEEAKSQYPHRYTREHTPAWARGTDYAPQYHSDAEWYANTTFPGEPGHLGGRKHCFSSNPSWPLGQRLAKAAA